MGIDSNTQTILFCMKRKKNWTIATQVERREIHNFEWNSKIVWCSATNICLGYNYCEYCGEMWKSEFIAIQFEIRKLTAFTCLRRRRRRRRRRGRLVYRPNRTQNFFSFPCSIHLISFSYVSVSFLAIFIFLLSLSTLSSTFLRFASISSERPTIYLIASHRLLDGVCSTYFAVLARYYCTRWCIECCSHWSCCLSPTKASIYSHIHTLKMDIHSYMHDDSGGFCKRLAARIHPMRHRTHHHLVLMYFAYIEK